MERELGSLESATPLERALRRDRVVVLAGIFVLVALAWAYTVRLAAANSGMGSMVGMAMPHHASWGPAEFLMMFVMWAVMMVAMMFPSATPMLLVFANVNRRRARERRPFFATGLFMTGYAIVWVGFSLLATLANWWLHGSGLLSSVMGSATPRVGGLLLVAAGAFQWTRLKHACLAHCRSPLGFVMTHWREGSAGALTLGLHHGAYCLGCCWVLMSLLFALGVMNLPWIAALAVFVLIEKIAPAGLWLGRIAGVGLVGWGAWLIATAG